MSDTPYTIASEALKACVLWPGSEEHSAQRMSALTREIIQHKIDRLSRCDDRTPDEEAYLIALEKFREVM